MNTRPYSDELTHYGVKGMKWGVRRIKKTLRDPSKTQKEIQTKLDKSPKLQKMARQADKMAKDVFKDLFGDRYSDLDKKKIKRGLNFCSSSSLQNTMNMSMHNMMMQQSYTSHVMGVNAHAMGTFGHPIM